MDCQILSNKKYRWVDPVSADLLNVPENSRMGYIVQVDLEYPHELYDKHNLYRLMPEHLEVSDDMLSSFQHTNFQFNTHDD